MLIIKVERKEKKRGLSRKRNGQSNRMRLKGKMRNDKRVMLNEKRR